MSANPRVLFIILGTLFRGCPPLIFPPGQVVYLPRQLLERPLVCLGDSKRANEPQEIGGGKEEKTVLEADAGWEASSRVGRGLRRVQEPEGTDDSARLAHGRGDAMARALEARREELRGDDEGRGVGPEVGEEESERVDYEKRHLVALAAYEGVAVDRRAVVSGWLLPHLRVCRILYARGARLVASERRVQACMDTATEQQLHIVSM